MAGIDPRAEPCRAPGPKIRVSPRYEKRAICNRVRGHPDAHQLRDRRSFRVIVEWDRAVEVEP